MEKFHRQDNMTITLGLKPGKGICLEFASSDPVNKPELVGNQREVLGDIVSYITTKVMLSTSPNHSLVRSTAPFIQGRTDDWLLIEFWTKDKQAIRDVCLILAGKFDFDFEEV